MHQDFTLASSCTENSIWLNAIFQALPLLTAFAVASLDASQKRYIAEKMRAVFQLRSLIFYFSLNALALAFALAKMRRMPTARVLLIAISVCGLFRRLGKSK